MFYAVRKLLCLYALCLLFTAPLLFCYYILPGEIKNVACSILASGGRSDIHCPEITTVTACPNILTISILHSCLKGSLSVQGTESNHNNG